jgi:RND family efflux transporter MFP subunit
MNENPVRDRLLLVLVLSLAASPTTWAQPGGGATPVVVGEVVEDVVAEGRTFVGTAFPSQTSVVGSAVDGRVVEVPVARGDWVTKGQTLVELLRTTVELELAAAEAELELRESEADELERGSRPEEIEQAKASLARAKALYEYARLKLARAETLYAKGGTTSRQELEEDRSQAQAEYQSLLEADAAYKLMVAGPRQEKKLQAKARVAMQQAEVDRLHDQVSKYTLRAPFDGYVTAKQTAVGQWISRGDPAVDVVAVDPMEIVVSVPEDYVDALAPEMSVAILLDALPDEVFEAKISRIVPQADVRSRSFPVIAYLDNPRGPQGHRIKAGMLAQVTFAVGQPKQALLVHKDALVLGGPTKLVYVVQNPRKQLGTVADVLVQTGVASDGYIEVVGDLKAGQKVVVEGNERLRPGMEVTVIGEREGRQRSGG